MHGLHYGTPGTDTQVHTEPAEYLRIYASYVYRIHKQGS